MTLANASSNVVDTKLLQRKRKAYKKCRRESEGEFIGHWPYLECLCLLKLPSPLAFLLPVSSECHHMWSVLSQNWRSKEPEKNIEKKWGKEKKRIALYCHKCRTRKKHNQEYKRDCKTEETWEKEREREKDWRKQGKEYRIERKSRL